MAVNGCKCRLLRCGGTWLFTLIRDYIVCGLLLRFEHSPCRSCSTADSVIYGYFSDVEQSHIFQVYGFCPTKLREVIVHPSVAHQATWLHMALPLGISFYTFELISYLVDVYKGRIPAERSLLRFWMFIMFFAHMIAGPIMRGKEFFPQIQKLDGIRFNPAQLRLGAFFIVLGLVKKMGIADQLAPYCDSFFSQASSISGAEGWTASVLYAFQIYCDFSGYSDMAVGVGYLFGLELARNFDTPYLSTNATEFWRRWHITLSSWIRDYIYISIGGSLSR